MAALGHHTGVCCVLSITTQVRVKFKGSVKILAQEVHVGYNRIGGCEIEGVALTRNFYVLCQH